MTTHFADQPDELSPVTGSGESSSTASGITPLAATVTGVSATGNPQVDGLLSGYKWSGTLTYSFPDSASDYPSDYGWGEPTAGGFAQISAAQQQLVHKIMQSVAGYTNLDIQFAGTGSADIRLAQSSEANPTAYAYYPSSNEGGDVWFGTAYSFRSPVMGDYYSLTHIHELGHALGLKHSQETGGVANIAVPADHDALEYTVMSYRSYINGPTDGYTNENFGFPTSFMMNDILALQTMYGADYTTNSTDSVYSWSTTTGQMFINGVGQGQPGANRVFLTIWDGGGNDTYDMSNYSTGVTINLGPGAYSITSSAQLAYLGNGQYAHGNVYNAYLFNNNSASYIENAVGGTGVDSIIGNAVDNTLDGRAGTDTLTGGGGKDVFVYGAGYGADTVTDFTVGGASADSVSLVGLSGVGTFAEILAKAAQVGANTILTFGSGQTLTLQNVLLANLTAANFQLSAPVGTNHAPSDITLANASVNESTVGAVVGGIAISDTDGDTAFTFNVSDDRFVIGGSPGAYELKLAAGVALDFETETNVVLSITAIDSGGLNYTKDFNISVNDLNGATINGTNSSQTINGQTNEGDTIYGKGGNDTIVGLGGNDRLFGDSGNDQLYGGAGGDTLVGGAGTDVLHGAGGDDILVVSGTGDSKDSFFGGAGTDTISVAGTTALTFSIFDAGASSIEIWQGNSNALLGTRYADSFDFSALTSVTGLTYVDAGNGADNIVGSNFADDLRGGSGNDLVSGGMGNDTLSGGSGNDRLVGGAGDDSLHGEKGFDTFVFSDGSGHDDIFGFEAGSYSGDVIEFDDAVFADVASVLAACTQVGSDTVITMTDEDTITLRNVLLTQLHSNDFVFV